MSTPILPDNISGYTQYDDYLAQRSIQGSRVHYAVVLPLVQVSMTLPVPDPNKPLDDNRQVKLGHARDFASYLKKTKDWHSGPLTVRTTSDNVIFEAFDRGSYGQVQIGILRVPRSARSSFRIVDGQHRILGVEIAFQTLNEEMVKARSLLAAAERNGEVRAVVDQHRRTLDDLQSVADRLSKDSMVIDFIVEDSPDRARQIFVDVANNALGITKAVTHRFDSRKVVNRALNRLLDDRPALLVDRVDLQTDRIAGPNPNLLGAGHLADIIRRIAVGTGNVTSALEQTLEDQRLAKQTRKFFDILAESFPDLTAVVKDDADPGALRPHSLVVSTTMLRILAGVYHNLRAAGMKDTEISAYFSRLAKHMKAPLDSSSPSGKILVNATPKTEAFIEGATAPGARAQQVKEVISVFTTWATEPPPGF